MLIMRITSLLCLAIIIALVIGLFRFAGLVAQAPQDASAQQTADGIVVLTGDAERISDAVGLLQEKRGRRLLISGVNPRTTRNDINRQTGASAQLFDCCVDLGYEAQNTWGNAVEAGRWSKSNGFTSLIVVTSNYHMPRSLMELRRVLPDTTMKPYAVESGPNDLSHWWRDRETAQLMIREYTKYLLAAVRIRLGNPTLDKQALLKAGNG